MSSKADTRDIWRFFGPLAAVSVLFLSGRLFQNYALLNFPDGVRQIATFTLASAVFLPCMSAGNFFPQLSNTLVKGQSDLKSVGWFAVYVSGFLTFVLCVFAWTPLGEWMLARIFPGSEQVLADIIYYLRWNTPVMFLSGWVNFVSGLLMQCHRTAWVSGLRVASLLTLIFVLVFGLFFEIDARLVIGLSCVLPEIFAAILGGWCLSKRVTLPRGGTSVITMNEVWIFFWPLALTTMMFTLSRPIVNQLVTVAGAEKAVGLWTEEVLAALAVAFTFAMIFQMTINQLRSVYITFAIERPEATIRFSRQLIFSLTAIMTTLALSPFAAWFFEYLQGVSGRPLDWALQNYYWLCAVPIVVGLRNHFHGLAMVYRRTRIMGIAAILRNGSILALGWLMIYAGFFEPWSGSLLLLVGFLVEAWIMRFDAVRKRTVAEKSLPENSELAAS